MNLDIFENASFVSVLGSRPHIDISAGCPRKTQQIRSGLATKN